MKIARKVFWCTCTRDKENDRKSWSYDPKQGTHVHADCGKPSQAVYQLLEAHDLHPRRS